MTALAEPLKAMGRFVHEAIAVDPESGIVYETEDRKRSGFYRFLPKTAGKLADFVILSDDILQGPPERILKTKILLTVMGGRETYRAKEY